MVSVASLFSSLFNASTTSDSSATAFPESLVTLFLFPFAASWFKNKIRLASAYSGVLGSRSSSSPFKETAISLSLALFLHHDWFLAEYSSSFL